MSEREREREREDSVRCDLNQFILDCKFFCADIFFFPRGCFALATV